MGGGERAAEAATVAIAPSGTALLSHVCQCTGPFSRCPGAVAGCPKGGGVPTGTNVIFSEDRKGRIGLVAGWGKAGMEARAKGRRSRGMWVETLRQVSELWRHAR
ncbi:hypothetical protein GCM10020001_061230 [Nonomuraea salmonea]